MSVTLEDADKQADAWRRLTVLVKAKAERKPTRIPPNARGIVARIEVRADVTGPDGRKVRDTDKPVGVVANGPTVNPDGTVETLQARVRIHGKVGRVTL